MPVRRPFVPLLLPLAALMLFAGPTLAAEAGSDGPAIVILDGSGSMWGTIGSERLSKFDLARQALRQSLSTLSPRVRLGLMSFGQRRRADCSDVEVLAAPEAGPPERVLAIVDKLNPKGKGPLSLALREAARQVPAGTGGSVIAIHDGVDNCAQDPCAAAADIAAANPGLRLFLISFGLDPADAKRLACVGAATGGKSLQAQTSAELTDAITETLRLANLERVDPATGLAVPAPKAATPPAPVGAPGLRLSAALAPDGQPLAAPLDWTVAKKDAPDAPIAKAHTPTLSIDLDPGSYVVEAKLGQVTVRESIEVKPDGPTTTRLSLDAGVLSLKAQADHDGATLSDPLLTVFAKDGDRQRPVWIGRDDAAELVLPAGRYAVRVEDGLASRTSEVTLTAGAGTIESPVLGTGRLELSAVTASGKEADDVIYTIEEDDPDAPQGRREVTRSADPKAVFTLPAGTYYVAARSGAAEARERIALGNGATIKHVTTLDLVSLTVVAPAAPISSEPGVEQPVVLRILSEDGQAERARAYGATGTFRLPPARYRVEAEVMGVNVKSLGVVDLTNGRGGTVQLKLEQGEVSVDAAPSAARHWRITDSSGRTVMHAGRGGTDRVRLAPGRYRLISDGGTTPADQAFELKSGERRQLSVGRP